MNLLYALLVPPIVFFLVGGFFSLIGLWPIGVVISIIVIYAIWSTAENGDKPKPKIDFETYDRICKEREKHRPKVWY